MKNLNESVGIIGEYTIKIVSLCGRVRSKTYKNKITVGFMNEWVKRMAQTGEADDLQPTYIAIGSDGTTVTENDTALGSETSSKAVVGKAFGALGSADQKSMTCYATWSQGEATGTHLEAGVYIRDGVNKLLISHVNINETVGALDALFIDFKFTLSNV